MKEFLKWLGVNEKVAKVVIWLAVIMGFLIMTNALLDSIGLPYYKITVDNLVKIDVNWLASKVIASLMVVLNFYTIIFLVFRVRDFKKILPYSIIYLAGNIFVGETIGRIPTQIYIILFLLGFCYFYSGKKVKYILYGIISLIFNTFIQYIWYAYKAKSINLAELNDETMTILTIDFFIIMAIIILVKEIYLKQRGCKKWVKEAHIAGSGLELSAKKVNSQKKSQKN